MSTKTSIEPAITETQLETALEAENTEIRELESVVSYIVNHYDTQANYQFKITSPKAVSAVRKFLHILPNGNNFMLHQDEENPEMYVIKLK